TYIWSYYTPKINTMIYQPNDEQPPQVEPPTQSQEMIPGQDNEDEGAPEVQDPDPEADLQELALAKSGREGSEGPDVMEDILPKLESIYMPEEGPDPEDDLQELAQPKVDREGRDGPDVTQELVSKLETIHMPEAGEGQAQD
uniref:GAGE domain-containing protein n=1 Tax=Rhinolophus ferrumequinum TaxID=59479 RepID=A0A671E9Z4_RHIFE